MNFQLQNSVFVIYYVEPSVSERREGSLRGNEGVSEDYERSSEGSGRDPSIPRDDNSSLQNDTVIEYVEPSVSERREAE